MVGHGVEAGRMPELRSGTSRVRDRVGWADTETLTEALRRALREHTVEQRRRIIAW